MGKMKVISALVSIFMTLPIWFYLLHEVLTAVSASDLSWFLYWVYVPASLFAGILARISSDE